MVYTCEVCDTKFEGSAKEAFELGWDTPEMFMSHCTCPKCPIDKTVWWRLMVEKKQPTDSEIMLLLQYNAMHAGANPSFTDKET